MESPKSLHQKHNWKSNDTHRKTFIILFLDVFCFGKFVMNYLFTIRVKNNKIKSKMGDTEISDSLSYAKINSISTRNLHLHLAMSESATGKGFKFPFPVKYSLSVWASSFLQYLLRHP